MSRRSRLFVSTQVKDWGQSPLSRVPDTTVLLPIHLGADLWLDASDATTITASSGDVSQWNNKGSLGNFTQATGAVQPKTGVTTQNGLNVLDFAGDYLTATNQNEWKFLHDGTKYIWASIIKHGTSSDPNAIYSVTGSAGGNSANNGFAYRYDDRASASRNNRWTFFMHDPNDVEVIFLGLNNFFTANQFQILSAVVDPGNATAGNRISYALNGAATAGANAGTATPNNNNPSFAMQIGAEGDNSGNFTGSIAEIVVVSGVNATETNRVALRDYLNTKWGVY